MAVVLYGVGYLILCHRDPLVKWDWSKIDTSQKHFSKGFIWGVATAAHQVEGGHQDINSFGWWEKQTKNGKSVILNGDKSGMACDDWNRYPEDIQLMKAGKGSLFESAFYVKSHHRADTSMLL